MGGLLLAVTLNAVLRRDDFNHAFVEEPHFIPMPEHNVELQQQNGAKKEVLW